jgi:anti-sigma B factor antagonist
VNADVNDLATGGGELEITVGPISGDHADITLVGRLDMVEAISLRERLASQELLEVRHLLFDLQAVTFIDSAGLAVLARSRRDLMLLGGTVTLVRPQSEDAMRVFRLTQFDEIFTMIDTRESDGR